MNKQAQTLLGVGTLVAIALVVAVPILIVPGGQPDTLQTRVAFWALAVSVVTLIAIAIQIKLASDEVGFVKEDLANNKLQLAEAMKRPSLACVLRPSHQFLAPHSDQYNGSTLACYVANTGNRLATNVLTEIFLPLGKIRHENLNADQMRKIDDVDYMVCSLRPLDVSSLAFFPNGVEKAIGSLRYHLTQWPSVATALWRIYDEYGTYPADGYGRATIGDMRSDR